MDMTLSRREDIDPFANANHYESRHSKWQQYPRDHGEFMRYVAGGGNLLQATSDQEILSKCESGLSELSTSAPEGNTSTPQSVGSVPAVSRLPLGLSASPSKKRTRAQRRRLGKKHATLVKLREQVLAQREELIQEHNDLNLRLAQVIESQQEIMNAIDGTVQDIFVGRPLGNQLQHLHSLWETTKNDAETYNQRLSRIGQLSNLLVKPEAELIATDADFVKEARRMASLLLEKPQTRASPGPKNESSLQVEDVMCKPPSTTVVALSESDRSISEKVQQRKLMVAQVEMYEEQLRDLEYEQIEDRAARQLVDDQEGVHEVPEAEFIESYNLAQKEAYVLLTAACKQLRDFDAEHGFENYETVQETQNLQQMVEPDDEGNSPASPSSDRPDSKRILDWLWKSEQTV